MEETVKPPRSIHLTVYLLGLAGAALLTALIIRQGAAEVAAAVASAAWALAAVAALHVAKLLADTIGWLMVIPKGDRLRLRTALWIHWLGESVSDLLPTARIGGDIVTARLAALRGMSLTTAVASMLVDVTACLFTKIVYTMAGLALLVAATGQSDLVEPMAIAALIGVLAIAGFYSVQRLGIFRWGAALASRLAQSASWSSFRQGGEMLDLTVQRFYARRAGVTACCTFAAISWVISAGEIWIALYALGMPTSFTTALILESAIQGVRGAMFLVPGALGVQESGYLAVGSLLGIPGDTALALSLIRRVRELIVGIPGLVVWQLLEGGRLWRSRFLQTTHGPQQFEKMQTRSCCNEQEFLLRKH